MDELEVELLAVRPDARKATLGRHGVFRYRDSTPAHTFDSALARTPAGWLAELTARDSWDEGLAQFLLDLAGQHPLPSTPQRITVIPAQFPAPWPFDCVVVVPPAIAGRFEHESDQLRLSTHWVFPAYQGEFNHQDDGEQFWHQVYRKDGWRSVVVRWDRARKSKPEFDA